MDYQAVTPPDGYRVFILIHISNANRLTKSTNFA